MSDTLTLPVLPLDDDVVLPGMVVPIELTDNEVRGAIDAARNSRGLGRGPGIRSEDKAQLLLVPRIGDRGLAGTGTLATEHYGRLVRDADVQAARERHGLAAQPLLCTVTRSGHIPPGIPLLADPDARMVIYSGAAVDLGDTAASVQVITVDPSQLSVASALHDLRVRLQARVVLCEGGPTVLGQLIGYHAIDELFLTFAGKLAGGAGPAIVSGLSLPDPLAVSLLWLLEQDGSLFLRYGLG